MKKNLLFKPLMLIIAVCTGVTVFSQTVTVSNCTLNGWIIFTDNTGTVSFVNGPSTPPLPVGSVHYSLTDGDGKAALVTPVPALPLASLTQLSYSTYVTSNQGGQAPALELAIDYTGDGTPDDRLVFEPVYQNGTFGVAQPAIMLNTWQTWNALNGGWWAASDPTSGPATYTLASYTAVHPTSIIVGMTLTTGGGNTWDNFSGNADALRVGIGGTTTTYNFEPCQEENDKKVTVCHNGKTITIGKSAVEAHLKHGDQMGACSSSSRISTNESGNTDNAGKYKVNNFPNPFVGTTHIQFNLPENGKVSIKVFDITGREVGTILNEQKKAGVYIVPFNANKLNEGIYQYLQKYHSQDKIILFRKNGSQESQIRDYFNDVAKATTSPLKIEMVDIGNSFDVGDLANRLDSTKRNICIAGSLDEKFGTNLLLQLSSVSNIYPLTVIGMPTWDGLNFIKPEFKNTEIIYTTPFNYNRSGGLSGRLNTMFEETINSRPTDMFFRGYETMLRFGLLLLDTKNDVASNLTRKGNFIFTQFDIQPVFLNKSTMALDYFENKKLYFIKYTNGIKSVVN